MNISQWALTLISVIAGFLLARVGIFFDRKRSRRIDELEKFYQPMVKSYMKSHRASAQNFSDLNEEDQNIFIDLINSGTPHMDVFLDDLCYQFNGLIGMDDLDECLQNEETRHDLNKLYNSITDYTFDRFRNISKKLYWPWYSQIAMRIRKVYANRYFRKMNEKSGSSIYWTF